MTCEKYEEILIETAAGGAVDPEIARHVESCARCRTTLERERELFSAIDNGLRARVNEQPRAGFWVRLHAQIAEETQGKPRWTTLWALAGVMALFLIVMAHPWAGGRKQPVVGNVKESGRAAQERPKIAESAGAQEGAVVRARRRVQSSRPAFEQVAAKREPEVLVPPDEAIAFAQFVAHVAARDQRAEAVVRPMRDQADENKEFLQLPLVDIADLVVEPAEGERK